jgi:NADP-dependent 3-hydroxy acid dehydrogenase YdfG
LASSTGVEIYSGRVSTAISDLEGRSRLRGLCGEKACRAGCSEGLRQEVKPYNIRATVISPGAVATELRNGVTEPKIAERIHKFFKEIAIPAESFARAVAFARASRPTWA